MISDIQRPKTMTVEQSIKMYDDIVTAIMEFQWAPADTLKEDIISDLEDISLHESAMEIARELKESTKVKYIFTPELLEYLDGLGFIEVGIIEDNVKQWVIDHNIKPKLQVGDTITFIKTIRINSCFQKDSTWSIHQIDGDLAVYVLKQLVPQNNKEMNGTGYINFEDLENNI